VRAVDRDREAGPRRVLDGRCSSQVAITVAHLAPPILDSVCNLMMCELEGGAQFHTRGPRGARATGSPSHIPERRPRSAVLPLAWPAGERDTQRAVALAYYEQASPVVVPGGPIGTRPTPTRGWALARSVRAPCRCFVVPVTSTAFRLTNGLVLAARRAGP
jgi:hypothetical protein